MGAALVVVGVLLVICFVLLLSVFCFARFFGFCFVLLHVFFLFLFLAPFVFCVFLFYWFGRSGGAGLGGWWSSLNRLFLSAAIVLSRRRRLLVHTSRWVCTFWSLFGPLYHARASSNGRLERTDWLVKAREWHDDQ